MEYIVVQAGGKGTRLKHLTANKPKALVPVENLPMIFHLFRKFPDKKFIIIADYKKEVLHKYLEAFADVKHIIIDAEGTGTCSGIKKTISLIPENNPFMLVWSDLILPKQLDIPEINEDFIGISQTFPCRWSYSDKTFTEKSSREHGVAGFFLFTDKSKLNDVPESGELVRFMQSKKMIFREIGLAGTKEFGLIEEYNKLEVEKCRPFNKITINDNTVIKTGIDEQGKKLAVRECKWYQKAKEKNSCIIPEIYGFDPLKMERIKGKNIYEYKLPYKEKKHILRILVDSLNELHSINICKGDPFSIKEAYYNKTISRLEKIRDLVPMADQKTIVINNKECHNIFYYKSQLEKKLERFINNDFCFIHGDCTFSNMMLRENNTPVLIDPRGYFGFTELYGDPLYDWAKLYYSLKGIMTCLI